MALDFKKEYKEFYLPGKQPQIVDVPRMQYVAVRGQGDPNEAGGAWQQAVAVLYAVAYTLKMSSRSDYQIAGFFDYVVPPLEGFWWQEGIAGVDLTDKSSFNWIAVIRMPDFVSRDDFNWAVETASAKKKMDCSAAEYLTIDEGLCVQIMHTGPYDEEPASIQLMNTFLEANGYVTDIGGNRRHHEIYLSDPRRLAPEKWKTVIRYPIRKC
ncbi:MAG: GyrI-like domain-containing protein [Bacillota bacterium]|nr:GyrI-like domain-containing protein [Bacillota bacterium]